MPSCSHSLQHWIFFLSCQYYLLCILRWLDSILTSSTRFLLLVSAKPPPTNELHFSRTSSGIYSVKGEYKKIASIYGENFYQEINFNLRLKFQFEISLWLFIFFFCDHYVHMQSKYTFHTITVNTVQSLDNTKLHLINTTKCEINFHT